MCWVHASPMLLCHLLHTYCLPILLYGLEAITISNANCQTLYVTWKTALYKIFKLNDEVNLLYVQYCLGILPISYVCLLYTSPSPRDRTRSRMPSSA